METKHRARWGWLAVLLLVVVGLAVTILRSRTPDAGLARFTEDSSALVALRDATVSANVVVIVLDAARADHLGCYGYPRKTTPNIDRIAQAGLVFERHFCQMPFTRPSTASLFTSQFPDTHNVIWDSTQDPELPFTMAAGLGKTSFRTVLFSSNPKASPAMGIGCGFEEAYYPDGDGGCETPEDLLTELGSWLKQHSEDRFFAYVHFLPPHMPYAQPPEYTQLFAHEEPPDYGPEDYGPQRLEFPVEEQPWWPPVIEHPALPEWINVYDANLRYADWAVGEVERLLEAAGVLDQTLLIITSDHGEAFGEHGYLWHTRALHDEASWIPLIIEFPGEAPPTSRINSLTQTIDVLPTLFDLLKVEYPADLVEGKSLLPLLGGSAEEVNPYTVIESFFPHKYLVRDARYALVVYDSPAWRALYDTESDPEQRLNIVEENPEKADELLDAFRAFAVEHGERPQAFLDAEMSAESPGAVGQETLPRDLRERLRSLGYLK